MRVCPKCKFIDPPHWKHVKYSYWIDSCSLENFKILYPTLAKQLRHGGDTIEDEDYVYRFMNNEEWIERKAKVDFIGKGWSDGTENGKRGSPYISPYDRDNKLSRWNWIAKNQKLLFEEIPK